MNLEANLDHDSSYKLLELDAELLDLLKQSDLVIRSSQDESNLVLCGPNKTWKLRQTNISNTALVAKYNDENNECIEAFTMVPSVLHAIATDSPELLASHVPTYMGDGNFMDALASRTISNFKQYSAEELKQHMPMSDGQFTDAWRQNCGSEVNNIACILGEEVVASVLADILLHVRAQGLQITDAIDASLLNPETIGCSEHANVVRSVIDKYSILETSGARFDLPSIIKFYGLLTLEKHASHRPILLKEFKTIWMDAIPISGEWELDIDLLKSRCVHGHPNTVRFLSPHDLKSDPRARFKQLFTVKPEWELSEMVPFIEPVWNKSIKLENFVMKFARRKKIGTKILVSSR